MASVEPGPGGQVVVVLEHDEADLVASLAEQVVEILAPPERASGDDLESLVGLADAPVAAPDDPAVRRLLPEAYRDDAERAAEFRRYTDADLRGTKADALRALIADVTSGHGRRARTVTLDGDRAVAWLHGINDIRLALGVRLDITEELEGDVPELSPRDPRSYLFGVYQW